jgi:hypothetical protein
MFLHIHAIWHPFLLKKSVHSSIKTTMSSYSFDSSFPRRLLQAGLAMGLGLGLPLAGQAQGLSCETLRASIAAKFQDRGVASPDLRIVGADSTGPGRVVGTCAQGSQRIVYLPAPGNATGAAPRRAAGAGVITECKDGSTPRDGRCAP